jgi:hypothetical protein
MCAPLFYITGLADTDIVIRNKFSHTLALLFISSYPAQWPDFFANFYELLQTRSASETPSPTAFNPHVSTLFLRVLIEISGEVADTILKGAREFTEERHRRDGVVRDHIRDRDSKTISDAVLTIISDNESHLVAIRNGTENGNPVIMEELIALAVRAFSGLIRAFATTSTLYLRTSKSPHDSLDQYQFYRHTRHFTALVPPAVRPIATYPGGNCECFPSHGIERIKGAAGQNPINSSVVTARGSGEYRRANPWARRQHTFPRGTGEGCKWPRP